MNRALASALALAIVFVAGCYRTRYLNLSPLDLSGTSNPASQPPSPPSGWRHFFLFGWLPGEMVIDAAQQCAGAENVASIETRQTFIQGLIEQLASFYINIYSPWTGRVVCKQRGATSSESTSGQ